MHLLKKIIMFSTFFIYNMHFVYLFLKFLCNFSFNFYLGQVCINIFSIFFKFSNKYSSFWRNNLHIPDKLIFWLFNKTHCKSIRSNFTSEIRFSMKIVFGYICSDFDFLFKMSFSHLSEAKGIIQMQSCLLLYILIN